MEDMNKIFPLPDSTMLGDTFVRERDTWLYSVFTLQAFRVDKQAWNLLQLRGA